MRFGAMDEDQSGIDTPRLLYYFTSGDDEALTEFLTRYNAKLERWAYLALRHAGLNYSGQEPEGLVNELISDIWQARNAGSLRPLRRVEDFADLFEQKMSQAIKDVKARQSALKRGGAGAPRKSPGDAPTSPNGASSDQRTQFRRRDIDLDQLASADESVETRLLNQDEVAALLAEITDPFARSILELMHAGNGVGEVASKLNVSERTVSRKLHLITARLTDRQNRR
jgi:DNA-directed RNA polymerase specialized sigma24 family protein